jgi:molecular chaperone DnaK
LKKAHGEQDIDGCKAGIEKLNEAFQAASQEMYAQQEGAPTDTDAGAESTGAEADAEVTDVDFEEVNEEESK